MSDTGIPLFQTREEQQQKTLDLTKQLLATIDQWGKTQGRKNVDQMRMVTLDALSRTISVICVHKELSSMAVSPKNVQMLFQRVYREEPIEAGEPGALLSLRARKDVLLRNLERAVQAF